MNLLYFAWVRQKVGRGAETIALPAGVTTVGALVQYLQTRGAGYDEAFADMTRVKAAVNQEHVGLGAPVSDGDEVAFFPPVTGG